MVGILIVSHGSFGESLIHCVCHVMGNQPERLACLGVSTQDIPGDVVTRLGEMVKQLDSGKGVLVLTDIYGATPSNIARRILVSGKAEGVAGVNLPMLIRALTYRDQPLTTVVAKAQSGGREGVVMMPIGEN